MSKLFMPTYDDARAELSRELQHRRAATVGFAGESVDEMNKRTRCLQHAYDLLVKCRHEHPAMVLEKVHNDANNSRVGTAAPEGADEDEGDSGLAQHHHG